MSAYGLMSQASEGFGVKDIGLAITVFCSVGLLFFICDEGHNASFNVKTIFQKKILMVELSWMNSDATVEINMFLRATEMSKANMNLGGFFDVNRNLFKSVRELRSLLWNDCDFSWMKNFLSTLLFFLYLHVQLLATMVTFFSLATPVQELWTWITHGKVATGEHKQADIFHELLVGIQTDKVIPALRDKRLTSFDHFFDASDHNHAPLHMQCCIFY